MTDPERSQDAPVLTLGSYRLVAPLGSGGMSSVYRAIHEETGHEVAIKVLPRYLAKNPILLQRFLREAQSAETLQHPIIVAIYDRGEENGRHYLVMEFVPGTDLHDRVQIEGPRPIAEAIQVIRQVALGLKFAAGKGLIHRDIKPANILLTPQGSVKIIDLGLALQIESDDERMTRDGTTVGTVDYMAPEQARDSRATSVRSDIYSLGCTFFYLLSGSAPFTGGDVTDKLRRHSKEAPPDVRKPRPEVPEALALLIQQMMAKRPERRFDDYDDLISALDALPDPELVQEPEPSYALIDTDEEDDSGEADSFSLEGEAPKMAGGATVETATHRPDREDSNPSGINLAGLAGIEEEAPSSRPKPPSTPQQESDLEWAMEEAADDPDDDEEPVMTLAGPSRASTESADFPLKTWLIRGGLLGLAFILLLVGIRFLRNDSSKGPEEELAEPIEVAAEPPEVGDDEPSAIEPRPRAVPRPQPPATEPPKPPTPGVESPPPVTAFQEPEDQEPVVVPEAKFPEAVEASFPPIVANMDAPALDPIATVRRLDGGSLTLEAGKFLETTVEIPSNGSFFESNLSIGGLSRLIRAGRGFRPIVVLESTPTEETKNRPAILVLDKKRITLEGLDLVVDVESLPAAQGALFLCKGTELTLRDCTVTLVGPENRPFALVRVEEPIGSTRRTRIRLERTLVRGRGVTVVDLGLASADIELSRSVLLCGNGGVISAGGEGPSGGRVARTMRVYRTICAARGPFLNLLGLPSAGAGGRPQVRALGSTFAHLGEAKADSLILVSPDPRAQPLPLVDWRGDFNEFIGWPSWLRNRAGGAIAIADLAAARRAWGQTDPQSREHPKAWVVAQETDKLNPADLLALDPSGGPILTRVAWPSPNLRFKTVDVFERLNVPDLAAAMAARSKPGPAAATSSIPPPTDYPELGSTAPAPKGDATPVAGAPEVFDVTTSPWVGDLGRFVADRITAGATVLRIVVRGAGPFEMTPIRLPEGTSLSITVDPPAVVGAPPLFWKPRPGVVAESLIDARGADVVLSGVRLNLDGTSKVQHLIRSEGGQLLLSGCNLTSFGAPVPSGAMIAFRAATSLPLLTRPGAPFPTTNRPVCRLVDCIILTGGDAVSAEVARGLVSLDNCLIACGGRALALRPQKVRRDLFEADLWLDRCTLAAERSIVDLGPWGGWRGGPDRPWLVSSRRCAFVDSFARPLRQTPLLFADLEALARGVLFWQAERDAYELARFATTVPTFIPGSRGPDVRRMWIDLWGSHHVVNVIGPLPGDRDPVVKLVGEKLKLATIVPGDLALIPDSRPGRRNLDIGADLTRLNITPTNRSGARISVRTSE